VTRATKQAGDHPFGGPWTEIKLDAVADYLKFYTSALKARPSPDRPFVLWYIDAFAGSGRRTAEVTEGGLFEGKPIASSTIELAGSAKRALDVQPPFAHFRFIEQHRGRHAVLEQLADHHFGRDILCLSGEANGALLSIFQSQPWSSQLGGKGLHRAVVFLDPYGMAVRWRTLEVLAATGSVDVWYLFPLNAVTRQLAGKLGSVDEHKAASLNEIFGTPDWRAELYQPSTQMNLLDQMLPSNVRVASQPQIEDYARARLGTIFSYVSEPVPLLKKTGLQAFSLFCLSANPSERAKGLIKRGVSHVLRKYGGPASRRKSGR